MKMNSTLDVIIYIHIFGKFQSSLALKVKEAINQYILNNIERCMIDSIQSNSSVK
jgi:hypothetical protein